MANSVQTGIEFLLLNCPTWASVITREDQEIAINAQPARSSGKLTRLFRILIFEDRATHNIRAKEIAPNSLPKFCPERHINSDATFCLTIEATTVRDVADANAWWKKLELFLTLQETASSTGIWPDYAQMAHGEAGNTQLELEKICNELGYLVELKESLRSRSGRIFDSAKLIRKKGERLRNGRAECPCRRKCKSGSLLLRRECERLQVDCPAKLMHKFIKAEQAFWRRIKGNECCGTMENCQLRVDKA